MIEFEEFVDLMMKDYTQSDADFDFHYAFRQESGLFKYKKIIFMKNINKYRYNMDIIYENCMILG